MAIPGGAATQIAQYGGSPAITGLNPQQEDELGQGRAIDQQRYGAAVQAAQPPQPIPTGIDSFDQIAPESNPEEEEQGGITHRVRGPDDKIYAIRGPEGSTPQQASAQLALLPPELLAQHLDTDYDTYESPFGRREKGRSALQGALLGFGDEATALLSAGMAKVATLMPGEQAGEDSSFGDIYRDIIETERSELERSRKEHPVKAFGTEIAGGLLAGGAGAGRVAGKTLGQQTLAGMGYGATYGFGAADPSQDASTLANLGERAKGGAIGGAVAGVLTPAMVKGGQAIGKAYRGAKGVRLEKRMLTGEGRHKLGMEFEEKVSTYVAMGDPGHVAYFKAARVD